MYLRANVNVHTAGRDRERVGGGGSKEAVIMEGGDPRTAKQVKGPYQ